MNHRERFLAALDHREPDRVPRYASLTPAVLQELHQRTGESSPTAYWDWDLAGIAFLPPTPLPDLLARFGAYHNQRPYPWILDWGERDYPPEWGVATRSAHFYHLSAPLAPLEEVETLKALEAYPFPDYVNEWRHDHFEAEVARLHAEGYPVSASAGWIFQTAWTLRTREKLFIDIYDRPDYVRALLRRITDIRIAQAVRYAEAGVDCISLNDDVGTQQSMIMSPATWRKWLKPYLAELIAAIRRVNPAVRFRYHSDGVLTPVIPELIEVGVNSLITVQPESMDIFEIKRRWGAQVCLEGTFGLQGAFARGSVDDVRAMVREQCEGMMAGGGWIASPGNGVPPEIPWANICAFFEALDEFGRYG